MTPTIRWPTLISLLHPPHRPNSLIKVSSIHSREISIFHRATCHPHRLQDRPRLPRAITETLAILILQAPEDTLNDRGRAVLGKPRMILGQASMPGNEDQESSGYVKEVFGGRSPFSRNIPTDHPSNLHRLASPVNMFYYILHPGLSPTS